MHPLTYHIDPPSKPVTKNGHKVHTVMTLSFPFVEGGTLRDSRFYSSTTETAQMVRWCVTQCVNLKDSLSFTCLLSKVLLERSHPSSFAYSLLLYYNGRRQ